ncbi:ATP-binding protein [Nonomuraea sp. SYSU D8015]|uniref:ATP-binding protein n=1 Tax=Nonomuraea sp. SYSU D8015 TaxID=2593644 RepID=UPI001660DE26|nr:helix-turn-helix transcriptional regulator [Nonomuraea sp. SYSU D8015]
MGEDVRARPDGDLLLEREAELAALRAAVDLARGGEGAVLVVQGPPGVGKTSLLAAVAGHARAAGVRVLKGRGRELEREVVLGVAIGLLAPALLTAAPEERERLLGGPAAPAAPLFHDDGSAGWPAAETMPLALCRLIANLTRRDLPDAKPEPILLAVDDAHWADEASLRFLTMLADRVDELPVAMVITMRDGDDGNDAPPARRLAAHPGGRVLTPPALTGEAVHRLVNTAFPGSGDALAAAVSHASGGNPFLVKELLRSLEMNGGVPGADAVAGLVPGRVLRTVLARLARLSAEARRLAATLAVLGDGTPLRRAAAHAELDLVTAERAADALAEAHLVRRGGPPAFVHPLVGAAVHADLPAFARARAHRRAAGLVMADGEGAEKAAGHLLVTEPEGDPAVVAVLRQAAGLALRRGDPAAATRLLRRAAAEPPPPGHLGELLIELARAQAMSGDLAAYDSVRQALGLLDDASPHVRAEALTLLAQIHYGRGDVRGAGAAREAALDLLDPGDPVWEEQLAGYLRIATFHPPLRRRGDRRLRPVLREARQGRYPGRPGLLAHVALRLALAGDPPAVVREVAERALADDPAVSRTDHGALLGLVVHALVIAGEPAAAESAADAAMAVVRRQGDVLACANAAYHRALAHFHQGALIAAQADLEAAQTPYSAGWISAGGWIGWLLARVHLELGDHAAAARALTLGDHRPADSMDAALMRDVRARLALDRGECAAALEDACAAGRLLRDTYDIDHPGLLPWRTTAAMAAHHLGDHERARRLARQALDRAREIGVPQAVGAASRLAGLVARPRPDLELLAESVTTLEKTPAALEHARALIDLGAALRRAGRRAGCREPLQQGLALAEQMHARPLAERARAELRTVGLRPRRAAVIGVDALTPAERRVAMLALDGQSNGQIAQTLFITTKTVETHLARVYRKLGITNRRRLHDVFAQDPAP